MKEKKERKLRGWKRVVVTILCVLLALILVLAATVGIYVTYLLNKIQKVDMDNESTISSSELEELLSTDPDLSTIAPDESLPSLEEIVIPTEPEEETTEPFKKGEHIVNILLIGQDARGRARERSDSMILVTFNKKTGDITLTSFMRDSYVQIPGYKSNKLNHAYQYGGMSLLNQTLYVNFGVEVDGNVEVNFAQFKEIIDLLGGVDISLTKAEAEYLSLCGMGEFNVGVNHFDGEKALLYARLRSIDSDYRRTERQRNVIMALIDAYKNQPLDKMLGLLEEIMGLVTTNMSNTEIIGYAVELFPMLASAQYHTQQIPAMGTFDQGNVQVRKGLKNWFQYNIDFEANRQILREIFGEE